MNLDALQKKLLAAARSHPLSDSVPYAFEKRIMARLAQVTALDAWTQWGRALWRAAATCLVIMALSGLWTLLLSHHSNSSGDFSKEFEIAVFVAADQTDDAQ